MQTFPCQNEHVASSNDILNRICNKWECKCLQVGQLAYTWRYVPLTLQWSWMQRSPRIRVQWEVNKSISFLGNCHEIQLATWSLETHWGATNCDSCLRAIIFKNGRSLNSFWKWMEYIILYLCKQEWFILNPISLQR